MVQGAGRKNREKPIMLVMTIFFAVSGIGKIWLWNGGTGNDFGLYLGIGFCVASVILFAGYYSESV